MQFAFIKCHGSGNDFPLIDARSLSLSDAEWAGVARALADRAGPVGGDGLLALTAGDEAHAFAMRMWNSDGSEAETCLNGLRCVARLGFELLGLEAARVKLKVSSADVARDAEIAPGVATVRTRAQGSLSTRDVGLKVAADTLVETGIEGLPSVRKFTAVAMPNPHLVTFVDAIDEAELVALGEWCEAAPPLIPHRANVSFVEQRGDDLYVRTFERGVGLTDSCGSAMAASVYAAARTGRIPFDAPATVFNKGGMVRGAAAEVGVVTISGNATFEWDATIAVDPETSTAHDLVIQRRRADEVTAWENVLASIG